MGSGRRKTRVDGVRGEVEQVVGSQLYMRLGARQVSVQFRAISGMGWNVRKCKHGAGRRTLQQGV